MAIMGASPEHQLHHPTPISHQGHSAYQSSPIHELNAGGGAHSNQISPCPTPTSSGQPASINAIHHATTPHHHHNQQQQPNGQLKVAH